MADLTSLTMAVADLCDGLKRLEAAVLTDNPAYRAELVEECRKKRRRAEAAVLTLQPTETTPPPRSSGGGGGYRGNMTATPYRGKPDGATMPPQGAARPPS